MTIPRHISRLLVLTAAALPALQSYAQQRIQFPSSTPAQNTAFQGGAFNPTAPGTTVPPPLTGGNTLSPVPPAVPGGTTPPPITGGTPPALPGSTTPPPVTLGQPQPFDPFATPGAASTPPALPGTTAPPGGTIPYSGTPYNYNAPGYPQQPNSLFPNGLSSPSGGWGSPRFDSYLRLFQDLRFRYTWLSGDGGTDVDINDVEIASTMNIPNFLFSQQPIAISPIFAFHFWDGPDTVAPILADLPSKAYSALLDFQWEPVLTPQLSAHLDASVGLYTDFQTLTSDTIRVQGTGLLVFQLTPEITLKGGVNYLDRVKVKLLPAGGVLWRPNEQMYFDIYFPQPKIARYLTTLGNTDIWGYIGGEYGGGSWTIERPGVPSFTDRIDINDIRVFAGLEWSSKATPLQGFVEVGYVFDREVIYTRFPAHSFEPGSTIMLRAGLSY